MRIGIVVDSTCDLPGDYIQNNNVVLLPITVRIGSMAGPIGGVAVAAGVACTSSTEPRMLLGR